MEKAKRNKILFRVGLFFIILTVIGYLGISIVNTLHNNNNDTTLENSKDKDKKDETEVKETETATFDEWSADKSYVKGDKVSYSGKNYEAKWWTKGETPDKEGDSSPWTVIATTSNLDESTSKESLDTEDSNEKLSKKDFKVVGYFPDWKPEKENEIQYSKLTHLNYAFAIPNTDGTLKPLDHPDLAKTIIKNGQKKGVKVLIAVGGWQYKEVELERTFIEATNTDEKCKKLAESILKLVDDYGFDGVDMDWEHPRTDGESKNQYTKLLKYLREGLDKRDKLLTSAVLAGVSSEGNVLWDAAGHTDEALSYVDWINVMAYDGGDGDRHSSYDFAVASTKYWRENRKLPAKKVVLGVPFYGRPSWASYEEILKADKDAHNKDKAMIDGKEAHYNGIETIKKKVKYAMENTSGIMIWEISQDTPDKDKSLLNAINEEINE